MTDSSEPPSYSPARRRRSQHGQTRNTTEHVTHLDDFSDRPWATLKVISTAPSEHHVPAFYEGEIINGTVQLDLKKEQVIKAVTVTAVGRILRRKMEGITHDTTFLRVESTLWSTSMGNPKEPESSQQSKYPGKLHGTFFWSFSLPLPRVVAVNCKGKPSCDTAKAKEYRLPPSFTERLGRYNLQYELIVHIRQGRLRPDGKFGTTFVYTPLVQPEPPSRLRQLAYQDNRPLVGVDGDPEGWSSLDPVKVSGTIFNCRSVEVTCTLSLAKPLCYTKGTVIPCFIVFQSTSGDTQALDLLSSPMAIRVRLQRRVEFGSDNNSDNRPTSPKAGVAFNEATTRVGLAVWWSSRLPGSDDTHTRSLEGEISLPRDLKPSCNFARFTISYFVVMDPFEATAFTPAAATEPLTSQSVEIATAYARGARPRTYAPASSPPSYHTRM